MPKTYFDHGVDVRLLTPVKQTQAVTMAHNKNAETAFEALANWWKRSSAAEVSDTVLRDYFDIVETLRPLLYASDLTPVGDLSKRLAAVSGTYEHQEGAPAFRTAPFATSPTPNPNTAYMYIDPLLLLYFDSLAACSSTKGGPASAERCHVLDQDAAKKGKLNVQRSLFSHDDLDGLEVLPKTFKHDVSNLVRKAQFSNRNLNAIWWYPDDLTLDRARKHVNGLVPGAHTHVDELLKAWDKGRKPAKSKAKSKAKPMETKEAGETIDLKLRHPHYKRRVRQAQALRYAAQWARAHLAARRLTEAKDKSMSNKLIKDLYDDTTDAIAMVNSLAIPFAMEPLDAIVE